MATSDQEERLITEDKIKSGEPYTIPQPERLYTVRPRHMHDKTSRGNIATFRIKQQGVAFAPSSSAAAALAARVRQRLLSDDGLAEFLVQSLQVGFNEKSQVIQTFGDAETVYYFGKTPTTLTISGSLLDDLDNDWFTRFVVGYNEFLRGTQLAKNFELVELTTNNATFTGTLMNLQYNQTAANDTHIPFTCTLLIKEFEYHSSYQWGKELGDDIEYQGLEGPVQGIGLGDPTLTQEEIQGAILQANNSPFARAGEGTAGFGDDGEATFAPAGTYAKESTTSFNETLGGIADDITKLSESINKFAGTLGEGITDALNPINDIIGSVNDISNAAFSVVTAINTTVDSVLDPITATVNNFTSTSQNLKNLGGAITSLPENLSEKISRFARGGGIANPAFLKSPSANINSSEALATMKGSNIRTPRSTGQVGPSSQATSSADDVARL